MARPVKAPSLQIQLSHLVEVSAAGDSPSSELPVVDFLLSSGVWLTGRVFGQEEGEHLLIARPEDSRLVTLLASEIVALSIADGPATEHLFGGSTSARSEAPTKLQLKRRVKSIEEKSSARLEGDFSIDIPWDDLPAGEVPRADLNEIISRLDDALVDIMGDDLGREALAGLGVVRFKMAPKAGVERDGSTMIVNIRAHADRLVGPTEMRPQLEAAM